MQAAPICTQTVILRGLRAGPPPPSISTQTDPPASPRGRPSAQPHRDPPPSPSGLSWPAAGLFGPVCSLSSETSWIPPLWIQAPGGWPEVAGSGRWQNRSRSRPPSLPAPPTHPPLFFAFHLAPPPSPLLLLPSARQKAQTSFPRPLCLLSPALVSHPPAAHHRLCSQPLHADPQPRVPRASCR